MKFGLPDKYLYSSGLEITRLMHCNEKVFKTCTQTPSGAPRFRSGFAPQTGRPSPLPYILVHPSQNGKSPAMTDPPEPSRANSLSRSEVPPTVLVVEDEDALRAGISRLLQGQGYQVLEAANGATALQLLEGPAADNIAL